MTQGKWDPFSNLSTLQDRINRLFEDAFPRSVIPDEEMGTSTWRPLVDIFETEKGVTLLVDLPGVDKNEVSLEVKENVLTIKGKRAVAPNVNDNQYYRRERHCGNFQRTFAMRALVMPDKIKASFKNGVLKIEIPLPEQEKPRSVTVDIS